MWRACGAKSPHGGSHAGTPSPDHRQPGCLHPQLVADKEFLECGFGEPPVSLEKTEAECECGFMGVPDPASGYYTRYGADGRPENAAGSGVVDSKGMTKIG